MSRPGRPRRNGSREASGRLQRISAARADAANVERLTVLAQPHRRGRDLDQRWGSAIGRFTMRHRLGREFYDAATEYGSLVRFYMHAIGVTRFINEGTNGSGLGVTAAKTRFLAAEVERLETALQKLNPAGFSALRTLAVFEREIAPEAEPAAVVVLLELGQLLRKVGRDRGGHIQSWTAEA